MEIATQTAIRLGTPTYEPKAGSQPAANDTPGSALVRSPGTGYVADCIECRDGRAAEVFRSELTRSAESDLKLRLKATDTPYAPPASDLDDVVSDALRATDRLAAENPDVAVRLVARARSTVNAAVRIATESVKRDDGIDEVTKAAGGLESGLDRIEEKASRNLESSASVLAIDTRIRQRSAIRIRTQEGDLVSLVLNVRQRLSARDSAISADGLAMTQTRVAVAERSKLSLRVEGDLNDAELAAIRSVIDQASAVADEFFAGDLSAAFEAAGDLEFDASQLERVNLRLRSREVSTVSFSQARVRQPEAAPVAAERLAIGGSDSAEAPPQATPIPPAVSSVDAAEPAPVVPEAIEPAVNPQPVARFFDLLSGFLRGVAQGFEPQGEGSGFRLHFSQSFKLQILKSVFQLVQPGDSDNAALSLIDAATDADAEGAADD